MSYCRKEGKDTIVFTTKEDHEKPSTIQMGEPEPNPGLIFPDGSINWNCPCLGGMATGPCGVEFRGAFECFHYSTADPKGSDCFGKFQEMQDCFARYPKVYDKEDEDKDAFRMDDDNGDSSTSSKEINSGRRGKGEIENTINEKVDGDKIVEKK